MYILNVYIIQTNDTTEQDHSHTVALTVSCLGHRPVIVRRAVIGSKGWWKLSTTFKL